MTEQTRNEDGTFASQPAEETGRTAELHEAGFQTLDEHRDKLDADREKEYGSDDHSIRQALRDRAETQRVVDRVSGDETVPIDYSSFQHPELPPDVALTADEAHERRAVQRQIDATVERANEMSAEEQAAADDLG